MLSEAADCANSPPPLTRQPMEAVPMAQGIIHPDSDNQKRCMGCKVIQALDQFRNKTSPKILSRCRDCRRAQCRDWYNRNIESERARARAKPPEDIEKRRAWNKQWAEANPERARYFSRRKLLSQKYNMTIEQHDALFASQGFACGACGSHEPNSKKGWSTDHCHESGVVRGIVCHHCNIGLGHAKDSIATLHKWVAYLEQSKV